MRHERYMDTAFGRFYIAVEDNCVVRLTEGSNAPDDKAPESVDGEELAEGTQAGEKAALELLDRAEREIREYFEGKRDSFDLPVKVKGTDFQKKVWQALKRIPYGETRSYGAIAAEVGSPKGARAVGMACNRNPVMLLIPCHRVVGSTGGLVGFAGGLSMKEQLLELENPQRRKNSIKAAGK